MHLTKQVIVPFICAFLFSALRNPHIPRFVLLVLSFFSFEVFTKSLIEAASALNHSDNSHWGWGELQNNKSRVLLVHGNCVDEGAMGQARYKKKIDWFKSVGSWFLDA